MVQAEPRPSALQLRRLLQVYANNLRNDPSDLVMRTKLAEVLRLLGRHEEAISLYSSVAWAHGVSGNLGQAIMICKLILELNPHHSATQEMLAKLYASKQIREQKQSVPVVQVGGRWVADPRQARPSSESTPKRAPSSSVVPASAVASKSQISALRNQMGDEPAWGLPSPEPSPEAEVQAADEPPGRELPHDERPTLSPGAGRRLSQEAASARRAAPASEDSSEPGSRPGDEITSCERPSSARRRPSGLASRAQELAEGLRKLEASQPSTSSPDASAVRQPSFSAHLPGPHELPEYAKEPTEVVEVPEPALQRRPAAPVRPPAPTPEPQPPSLLPELSAPYVELVTSEPESSGRAARLASAPPAGSDAPFNPNLAVTLRSSPSQEELRSLRTPQPAAAAVPVAEPAASPTPPDGLGSSPLRSAIRHSLKHIILSPEPALPGSPVIPEGSQEIGTGLETPTSIEAALSAGTAVPTAPTSAPPAAYAATFIAPVPGDRSISTPGVQNAPAEPSQSRTPRPTRLGYHPTGEHDVAAGPEPTTEAPPVVVADEPAPPQAEEERSTTPSPPLAVAPVPIATVSATSAPAAPRAAPARPTERMDSALVNSMLRLDAEQAFLRRPAGRSYASIQREVSQAGAELEEREIAPEEAAEAERSLLDTLREPPVKPTDSGGVERYLTPFPLFSDLDTPAFLAVIRRLDRRVLTPGTWVFREGDPGDSLYLVSSGVLTVLKTSESGQPIQLARLGGGSFFGEFGLLTDSRRHASVRCLEEAELLELRRDELITLCEEHPSITWTLRTFYQQRVMSNVLATSPIFQTVSPEDRKSVLARFGFRRFMPNEIIIEEDKQGTGFYVILVGSARVSCKAEDGSEVDLGVLSEGNYFGEMSLLSGFGAEATVRAATVTEVLMLSPQDFYGLTADHPEIWAVVQAEAERRRQDTARRLAVLQDPIAGDACLL
jgi:CRP-like cAMP-binding protein